MLKASVGTSWEFDRFTLLREMRLLLSAGTPVPLMSKAFDTLVLLVENRDRVVTKDELLRAVWPDVIVEEGNLTQQIFLLRRALGDTAQQPRYIVTVPGHGYRFAAPVREISPDSAGAITRSADAAPPRRGDWRGRPARIGAGVLALGVLAVLAILAAMMWTSANKAQPSWDLTKIRRAKLTETGKSVNSAISPDGQLVAYTQNDGDEYSLWVTHIATGGKKQVVAREAQVLEYPVFTPDGKYLYFTRGVVNRGTFVLYRVPAIGGVETPILDDVDTPVSFSPDGERLVFMRGVQGANDMVIANADGGFPWTLHSFKAPQFSFVAPSWSPDGRLIAASVGNQDERGRSSIVVVPVDGSAIRRLYSSDNQIGRVRWLPDGSGLLTVMSDTPERPFPYWSGGSIWRIDYRGWRAERLTPQLEDHDFCCLDITENGSTIASVVNSLVSDIWVAHVDDLDRPRQITWASPSVARHSWLPDNRTIAYRDLRGRLNTIERDVGGGSLPLPDTYTVVGGVSACGDGRHIVFAAPGNSIWRVTPKAGGALQITRGHVDSRPMCSPDGKWVAYESIRQNVPTLWRVAIEGGESTPLIKSESYVGLPSPSGRMFHYTAFEWEQGVRHTKWIVISSDNRKRLFTQDIPHLPTTEWGWAPDESGIDYVVTTAGVSNIWRQPLAGGSPTQITHLNAGKIFSFAWSPDGQWLSLGLGANRSDVVSISRQP